MINASEQIRRIILRKHHTVHGIHAAAPRLTIGAAAVLAAVTCLPLLMIVLLV